MTVRDHVPTIAPITQQVVEALLARIFIDAAGTSLRDEDRKKAIEVRALLDEIARLVRRRKKPVTLVDAAAGKAYLGLMAAELVLGPAGVPNEVIAVERAQDRVDAAREAADKLGMGTRFTALAASVASETFPRSPTIVVALHACGEASDAVIDATIASDASHLLLVPCCTARGVRGARAAEHIEAAHGLPRHGAVRKRLREVLVLAERVRRLEAAGYETEVVEFVPQSVTPYNVLLRARRVGEPVRSAEAKIAHDKLLHPRGRA